MWTSMAAVTSAERRAAAAVGGSASPGAAAAGLVEGVEEREVGEGEMGGEEGPSMSLA